MVVAGWTCPEYLGPIIHRDYSGAAIRAIAACLRMGAPLDSIAFLDVPPDDLATTLLVAALAGRFPAIRYPGEVCRYFRVPETYEAPLKRLSSHGRQRERRQRRRAGKELDARLEILSLPDTIARAFPDIVPTQRLIEGQGRAAEPVPESAVLGFSPRSVRAAFTG